MSPEPQGSNLRVLSTKTETVPPSFLPGKTAQPSSTSHRPSLNSPWDSSPFLPPLLIQLVLGFCPTPHPGAPVHGEQGRTTGLTSWLWRGFSHLPGNHVLNFPELSTQLESKYFLILLDSALLQGVYRYWYKSFSWEMK